MIEAALRALPCHPERRLRSRPLQDHPLAPLRTCANSTSGHLFGSLACATLLRILRLFVLGLNLPTMAKSKQEDPGYNYLRLKALDAHQLPPHPELDNGANGPDLKSFIHNLLQDRREISATGTYTAKEPKDFGEQYPQVRLFTKKAGKEHWAFRTSLSRPDHHAKASFREFEYALKQNHSKHEKEFTDSIFDCNKLLVWNDAELEKAVDGLPFTNLTMEG